MKAVDKCSHCWGNFGTGEPLYGISRCLQIRGFFVQVYIGKHFGPCTFVQIIAKSAIQGVWNRGSTIVAWPTWNQVLDKFCIWSKCWSHYVLMEVHGIRNDLHLPMFRLGSQRFSDPLNVHFVYICM